MLAKLHPLLGAAMGLDQGERITGFLMPLKGHHPAEVWNVRARPMKLGMQGKGLLKGLLKLLKMAYVSRFFPPNCACTFNASYFKPLHR